MVIFIFINGCKKTKENNILKLWKYTKFKFQWPQESFIGTQPRPSVCILYLTAFGAIAAESSSCHGEHTAWKAGNICYIFTGLLQETFANLWTKWFTQIQNTIILYGSQTVWSLVLNRFEAWQFCTMKQRGEPKIYESICTLECTSLWESRKPRSSGPWLSPNTLHRLQLRVTIFCNDGSSTTPLLLR